ncbi:hypothetical protein AC249_AIPGENE21552, partial [Exaiptasia diaphana]
HSLDEPKLYGIWSSVKSLETVVQKNPTFGYLSIQNNQHGCDGEGCKDTAKHYQRQQH